MTLTVISQSHLGIWWLDLMILKVFQPKWFHVLLLSPDPREELGSARPIFQVPQPSLMDHSGEWNVSILYTVPVCQVSKIKVREVMKTGLPQQPKGNHWRLKCSNSHPLTIFRSSFWTPKRNLLPLATQRHYLSLPSLVKHNPLTVTGLAE